MLRASTSERFEVASAGTEATRVHPLAIRAMDEVGIDLRGHHSKTLDSIPSSSPGTTSSRCATLAAERCPVFPSGGRRLHWSFEDPAAVTGSEEERLAAFRRIRDAIATRLRDWAAKRIPA